MWVFALRSPFVPAEGFRWSGGGVEENSSITQVHPHSPSVWQTIQRHSAAGDRRKRRVAGSVGDTEVKIQTSSRQRQLAVPHPAPSPPPSPSPSPLPCWVGRKSAQVQKNSINWFIRNILKGRPIYFLPSRRCPCLLPQTPPALPARCLA